jgi:hypothetical protein
MISISELSVNVLAVEAATVADAGLAPEVSVGTEGSG